MFADESHTPDHDFVLWLSAVAWEEPEEEFPLLVILICDGEKTGVTFTDVPRDVGNITSVDGKCYCLSTLCRGHDRGARLTCGGLVEKFR